MKILISVKDPDEASAVIEAGGVDIIDVKNPSEGTLGANHPWVIKEVRALLSPETELAASIGDLEFKPGGASLAAYGTASLGVDYVTASMYHIKPREVGFMTSTLSKAVKEVGAGLIVAGYMDYERCGSVDPSDILSNVEGADYIMLDTAIKDGKNILDFATPETLFEFKEMAHNKGLKLIIAGSIRMPQLPKLRNVEPDVLGFRGVVCKEGVVKKELVEQLVEAMNDGSLTD